MKTARSAVLCGLLPVLCVLLAWPFAEMGFDDDWSYARTARIFAETGHFVYNGWATAMLGWQIWWGALFIKAFGFSFTVLRFSTWPLAFLSVVLFHQILIRCGVTPRNAVLGSLTLGLSPLFLVMTASYMSDIPGLLCVLVFLYCCLRAAESEHSGVMVAWLALAAGTSVAGGTARQICWLGALIMVPATAWLLRRRRAVAIAGAVLWIASLASVYLCLRWYRAQPYSAPQNLLANAMKVSVLLHSVTLPIKILLCFLLILLPVLCAWLPGVVGWRRRRQAALAAGLAGMVVFWVLSAPDNGATGHLMPWLLDVIASLGSAKVGYLMGVKPASLGFVPRVIVSAIVIAAGVAAAVEIAGRLRGRRMHNDAGGEASAGISWRSLLWITLPFSIAYAGLVLMEGMVYFLLDRYLLVLLAIGILLLVRYYQEQVAARMPAICWWVLAIFTVYSVAGLHDIYALQRARIRASDALLAAGIPRTNITGGFEYDGWTQIEAQGYVHVPLIQVPAGAGEPRRDGSRVGKECTYWLYPMTPAIEPKYYVVLSPLPCLGPSRFPAVEYGAWLPPFRRELYIEQAR